MSYIEYQRQSVARKRLHKADEKWDKLPGLSKRHIRSKKWTEKNPDCGFGNNKSLPKTVDKMKQRYIHQRSQGSSERYHRSEGNYNRNRPYKCPQWTDSHSQASLCRRKCAFLEATVDEVFIRTRCKP